MKNEYSKQELAEMSDRSLEMRVVILFEFVDGFRQLKITKREYEKLHNFIRDEIAEVKEDGKPHVEMLDEYKPIHRDVFLGFESYYGDRTDDTHTRER